MNKEIRTHENPEFGKVRAFNILTRTYFSANDVCKLLGYKNRRKALAKHIDYGNIVKTVVNDFGRNNLSFLKSGLDSEMIVVGIDKNAVKILAYVSKKKDRLRIMNWILGDVAREAYKYSEAHPTDMYGFPIEEEPIIVERSGNNSNTAQPVRNESNQCQSDTFVFPEKKEEKTFGENLFDFPSEDGNTYTTEQVALELLRTANVLNQELEANEIQFLHKGKWHLSPQYSDKGLIRYESVETLDSD